MDEVEAGGGSPADRDGRAERLLGERRAIEGHQDVPDHVSSAANAHPIHKISGRALAHDAAPPFRQAAIIGVAPDR
jgi:hypothetical protein